MLYARQLRPPRFQAQNFPSFPFHPNESIKSQHFQGQAPAPTYSLWPKFMNFVQKLSGLFPWFVNKQKRPFLRFRVWYHKYNAKLECHVLTRDLWLSMHYLNLFCIWIIPPIYLMSFQIWPKQTFENLTARILIILVSENHTFLTCSCKFLRPN